MALEGSSREQQLKNFSVVPRSDNWVERGAASAEAVNAELDSMRETTGKRLKAASSVVKAPENERKLLAALEGDYERQTADLRATGQANEGMFTKSQIFSALTPEVLARALRIEKLGEGATPKGLLISDSCRHEKVSVIENNKVQGQKNVTIFAEPDNKDDWNGGREWPEQGQWQYKILQGEPEVADDQKIRKIRGNHYGISKAWVAKIENAGLDVLTGVDPYLALMRQSLVEGKPVDHKTFTVLNAKRFLEDPFDAYGHLAYGHWRYARMWLRFDFLKEDNHRLRLRAAVNVDVPKA